MDILILFLFVHRQADKQTCYNAVFKQLTTDDYTQYGGSGTGPVGRYQNFDSILGTVDINFLKQVGHVLLKNGPNTENVMLSEEILGHFTGCSP